MIPTQEALQSIEEKLGTKFPPSYKKYLANYREPFEFSQLYPHGKFLETVQETKKIKKTIQLHKLLPFFVDEQYPSTDYYCFQLNSTDPEYKVVVFCVHAIVDEWENFDAWLHWSKTKKL